MTKTILRIALLAIAILSIGVSGQQDYTEENFALSDSRPQSCQLIIETSRFYGNCCSLKSSTGGGCVLNVKNGWCRINGQYWGETWNSTDNNLSCDPSEFEIQYSIDWSQVNTNGGGGSAAASFPLVGLLALSAAVSALLF